jgi:hypothetical protein
VIKIISDLRQIGGFSPGAPVSCTNKTDHHDITDMLLKVLTTTSQTKSYFYSQLINYHETDMNVISCGSVLLVQDTGAPGEKPPICRKSLMIFIT